jgi:S-adenosylmethionine-dependent methyltransferase
LAVQDRNFDGLAQRFEDRIYGTSKGRLREQLLWRQLQQKLPCLSGEPLDVLDAGGGLGQMSARLLMLGHRVTLNDISAEMLRRASQRLAISADLHRLEIDHGPAQRLCAQRAASFDLVVSHALLEWLAEPRQALVSLVGAVRPGGYLSLAFYNRHSLVFSNARQGNLAYLLPAKSERQPRRKGLSPPNAQFPERVLAWVEEMDMELLGQWGVRVIHDWLPEQLVEETRLEQLLEVEEAYADRQPYCYSGRYFHLLARRKQP